MSNNKKRPIHSYNFLDVAQQFKDMLPADRAFYDVLCAANRDKNVYLRDVKCDVGHSVASLHVPSMEIDIDVIYTGSERFVRILDWAFRLVDGNINQYGFLVSMKMDKLLERFISQIQDKKRVVRATELERQLSEKDFIKKAQQLVQKSRQANAGR